MQHTMDILFGLNRASTVYSTTEHTRYVQFKVNFLYAATLFPRNELIKLMTINEKSMFYYEFNVIALLHNDLYTQSYFKSAVRSK